MLMLDCTEIKVQNELVVFFRLPAHFDHYIPDHLIKNVTAFENVIRTNFFQKEQIEEIPKNTSSFQNRCLFICQTEWS